MVDGQRSFSVVPPRLAVVAMRDNGYRNAAYALAELMDNAIQAGADSVELLTEETEVHVGQRTRRRIQRIATLDNGSGMTSETLRIALQFGNGTHLDDRSGIGRFGMGLPSASISQARRVDVWTWTEGIARAIHSYIDVDEIASGKMVEVPEPSAAPVPDVWQRSGEIFGASGTIVVWSKVDRCAWKTANALMKNSEFVIGRMYRRFLHDRTVRIRMASFVEGYAESVDEYEAQVNDPMYLMAPSSTPDPYDTDPMFRPWGSTEGVHVDVQGPDGQEHRVHIRFTFAREEARSGHNPGARPYGKHAARNVGVSILRAGRELEMEQGWVLAYDPRERWWGAEIEFPPALDEVFGVTNNKQSARNLSDAARIDIEALSGDRSIEEWREELDADDDPLGQLVGISELVTSQLRNIRDTIEVQTRGQRGRRRRFDENSPEAVATEAARARRDLGHVAAGDAGEELSDAERRREVESELIDEGLSEEDASFLADAVVEGGLRYQFTEVQIENAAFFSVRQRAGVTFVQINIGHPAYAHLVEILADVPDGESSEELRARLTNALNGLKLLLAAWARFEDEQTQPERREMLQDVRVDWGRVARGFLRNEA